MPSDTSPVESLYVTLMNLVWRLDIQSSHFSTLVVLKHCAYHLVFESRYVKLFDARPNAIHIFGLRIRQILFASNISIDSILETSQYFAIPSWYIKPPDILFDLVHLRGKKSHKCLSVQATFLGNKELIL